MNGDKTIRVKIEKKRCAIRAGLGGIGFNISLTSLPDYDVYYRRRRDEELKGQVNQHVDEKNLFKWL